MTSGFRNRLHTWAFFVLGSDYGAIKPHCGRKLQVYRLRQCLQDTPHGKAQPRISGDGSQWQGHRTCCLGSFQNHCACTGWGWEGTGASNGDVEPGLRNLLSRKEASDSAWSLSWREGQRATSPWAVIPAPTVAPIPIPRGLSQVGGRGTSWIFWSEEAGKASRGQENRPWSRAQKKA